jgi:uncharacterized protein (TIGR00730 family)
MSDRLRKNIKLLNMKFTKAEVGEEIERGLKLLKKVDHKIVTILGSHITTPDKKIYKHCEKTAYELGKRGYAIATGGGPGLMYAANSGAMKAGANSIGIRAGLIKNEKVSGNPYTHLDSFKFLFVRRFILSIKSDALIFYPGGYGTLNEFFEYVVLIETGLVDKVPIICVDKKYWTGMRNWLRESTLKKGYISDRAKDLNIISYVDKCEDIIKIIQAK